MNRASTKGRVKSLHDGAYERLVQLMVERRDAAGVSQQAVADALGWQQSIIAKIETVQRRMDIVEFLRIAQVIGFDPIKFLREIRDDLSERGEL